MATTVGGIILAGGKSRRMGQNKALTPIAGKTMLQWVYDAIAPLCQHIIISSNTPLPPLPSSQNAADIFKETGPAGGIHSGLVHSPFHTNILVSCDTPFVNTGLFRYMLQQAQHYDVAIARHKGITEPLIGIYTKTVAAHFEKALKSGSNAPPRIIRNGIIRYTEIDITPDLPFFTEKLFTNINTPRQLQQLG